MADKWRVHNNNGVVPNVAGKSRAKWLGRMQRIVVRQISREVEDEEAAQKEHA